MTMSTSPVATAARIARASASLLKRLRLSMRNGYARKRSRKVRSCCSLSTVVGTSTATCRPASTALKAARIATSVLPKPTSPQTRRSIGRARCMSRLVASIALSWSSVSSQGNSASNSRCQSLSAGNAIPGVASRTACTRSISAARSRTESCASATWLFQRLPPIAESGGLRAPAPTYFCTSATLLMGTCSTEPPSNCSVRNSTSPPSRRPSLIGDRPSYRAIP